VISTPSRDATLFKQLREESQKHLCQLATRKVTVATLVGQGELTLRHLRLESEAPLSDQSEEASDPGLVPLLRAELGLSSPDLFSMTVTDYDMKPGRVFEAPPSAPALFDHIDSFPSRRSEKEKERKGRPPCSQRDLQPGAESSLLRFLSKRRLLLVSAPSEDDDSFQQQLSALADQECPLGIRHFAALQLTGVGDKVSGSVQLFPLNGEWAGPRRGWLMKVCLSVLTKQVTSPGRSRSDGDGAAVWQRHQAPETDAAGQQGLLQHAVCGEGRRREGLVPLPPVVPGQHLRPGGLHGDPPPGGQTAGETLPRSRGRRTDYRLK
ncbi:unnamed protein product, partial [Tetraodon nigroviridis]